MKRKWILYGVAAAIGYFFWQRVQLQRRLAQPVLTDADKARIASSVPSNYNF